MNVEEMQQCVRSFLFAQDSGYASGDWREMKTSAHFFINESTLPLNIVLYDDGERIEIVDRTNTHSVQAANTDELLHFLGAHVPTGARLDDLRRAEETALDERDRLEAVRLTRMDAAEACVQAEDVARLAVIVADSMSRNLDVITVSGRQSLTRKTLHMLQLALEAALPAPTEY